MSENTNEITSSTPEESQNKQPSETSSSQIDRSSPNLSQSNLIEAGIDVANTDECIPKTIRDEAKQTFSNIADYIQAELETTVEDFKLIGRMNEAVTNEYKDMSTITTHIRNATEMLNSKYAALEGQFQSIRDIDASITALEQAAYKLDNYSKRLEAKFKTLTVSK